MTAMYDLNGYEVLGNAPVSSDDRFSTTTTLIGDTLQLYATLLGSSPLRPAEIALQTGLEEDMVRAWLAAHAVRGYVDYDPGTGSFSLAPALLGLFGRQGPRAEPDAADLQFATWEDAAFE